jgi:hypothetical protein
MMSATTSKPWVRVVVVVALVLVAVQIIKMFPWQRDEDFVSFEATEFETVPPSASFDVTDRPLVVNDALTATMGPATMGPTLADATMGPATMVPVLTYLPTDLPTAVPTAVPRPVMMSAAPMMDLTMGPGAATQRPR